jgi:hypothetical protein
MTNCIECNKNLGKFGGYYHPIFGKRWLFCKSCYDKIDEKGSPLLQKIEKNGVPSDVTKY